VHGQPVLQIPQDLYIPPDALEVFLDAFEGPLDLLLYLIRRQNLNILDIPVAEITRQYVDYIEGDPHELRFELAAEYLVMAAILAEIKSRMLLPRRPSEEALRRRGRPARRTGPPPAGVRTLQAGRRRTSTFELFEEAERPEPPVFKKALEILRKSCDGRAFELREVASGYRLQIREKFSPWVGRLWEERPQRYSRAMLETMALIAYRQPITRGEIEDVRGVAVNSHIVKTLLEREWIRIVGYRDVPGKPAMFATTKVFLDHFNLKNLDDLPPLAELREMETEPELDFDDAPVPASLQELADATAEPEEPKDETSFHTLLLELDDMEQGIKTDFDDLLRDGAAEPESQVNVEVEPEPEAEPEEDILGVAQAREKLLAAVAALEQPPLSDEEDEARALAEAIEAERRQLDD
jgi:segregation and condensation protein B